jgi:hypothetical protein
VRGEFATEAEIPPPNDPSWTPPITAGDYVLVGTTTIALFYAHMSTNSWLEVSGGGGGSSPTPETIKSLYESNPNTNAFTDVDKAVATNAALLKINDIAIGTGRPTAQQNLYVPVTKGAASQVLGGGQTWITGTQNGQVLTFNNGVVSFQMPSATHPGLNGSAATPVDQCYAPAAPGSNGALLYSRGSNIAPTWLSTGSTGYILEAQQASPPKWVAREKANNGLSALSTIYAPTSAGNAGSLLVSQGSYAPTWLQRSVNGSVLTMDNGSPAWVSPAAVSSDFVKVDGDGTFVRTGDYVDITLSETLVLTKNYVIDYFPTGAWQSALSTTPTGIIRINGITLNWFNPETGLRSGNVPNVLNPMGISLTGSAVQGYFIANTGTVAQISNRAVLAEEATLLANPRTLLVNNALNAGAVFDGGASITIGSEGILPTTKGGTGITVNPNILTNLGSTSSTEVFSASPRPGVTGILPQENGGTGTGALNQDSNIFVPASGVTPVIRIGYLWGPMRYIILRFNLDVSYNGSTDVNIGTIDAGFRPNTTINQICSSASNGIYCALRITAAGTVTLAFASGTIAAGTDFICDLQYFTAD